MTAPLTPQPDPEAASSAETERRPSPAPLPLSAHQSVGHVEAGATAADAQQVGFTAAELRGLLEAAITAARQRQAPSAPPPSIDHIDATVVTAFRYGRLVPFLGAGVNLCGRPEGVQWRQGQYLPSGTELATHLGESFSYPAPDPQDLMRIAQYPQDLMRIAQYVALMSGGGPLYDNLQEIFTADYSPTAVHQLLAMVPALLRAKGYRRCHQLIMTTNYDDLMERTLSSADEQFDVVKYVAANEKRGGYFEHSLWPHDSEPVPIDTNEYGDLPIELPGGNLTRTIVLKLHGAVDRSDAQQSSFVITEDDYIEYLAGRNVSNPLPKQIEAKLQKSNFLFLGYSLRDWNLRVILRRIWGSQKRSYPSWAIQKDTDVLDQKFWVRHEVELLSVRLEDYVTQLATRLSALPLQP